MITLWSRPAVGYPWVPTESFGSAAELDKVRHLVTAPGEYVALPAGERPGPATPPAFAVEPPPAARKKHRPPPPPGGLTIPTGASYHGPQPASRRTRF